MEAFIEFKVGSDGELSVMIHKLLWDELHRGGNTEIRGDFVHVAVTALTRANLVEVTGSPGSQEPPCKPSFRLIVGT